MSDELRVITRYKTSKGYFLSLEEASKKKNRAKIWGEKHGKVLGFCYEEVKEDYVLQLTITGDYLYFKLEEVKMADADKQEMDNDE